jgi:transcriptional regulator with XRE-family HTH domain
MVALFLSPHDVALTLAKRAREARLASDLTQAGLASRAGVSVGSLKRFEQTGAASLEAVIRIAIALRADQGFDALFQPPQFNSLDELTESKTVRKRGRRT